MANNREISQFAGLVTVNDTTNDVSIASTLGISGSLLVGIATSPRSDFFNSTNTAMYQVEGNGAGASKARASIAIVNNSVNSDPDSSYLILARSYGSTPGAKNLVTNNGRLGQISFQGADGTELVEGASIEASVDGTSGANDLPTRLVFGTTADGASSPTEQLRITSNRYIRLASGTGGIQFNGDTASANALDDYEEGTWTPSFSVSGFTQSISSTSGRYTKIGRVVTAIASVALSSTGRPTSYSQMTLPFTCYGGQVGVFCGVNPAAGIQGGSVYIAYTTTAFWYATNGVTNSASWVCSLTYEIP